VAHAQDLGRRVLLVWNPASTQVTAETLGSVLVQMAGRVDVVAVHTQEAGDGERLGRFAADERFDAVFVLGGDGTANEVVNGAGDRVPIGVLPAGGTSVLPRALGLPDELDEAVARLCDALEEGSERSITVGKLNDRCFTFAAGIGIDAEIVKRIDERGRGGDTADDSSRPGDLWFVREAIGALFDGDFADAMIHVEVPGKPDIHAASLFVANCSPWSFAGPVPLDVAPDASFEGGLDLVAIDSVEPRSAPKRLVSLLRRGDKDEDDGVHRLHNLEQATVRCDRPLPVQVDGELVGELDEFRLAIVRNAARLLV
jgi:diacylglycerol kinase family enzyme